MFPCVLKYRFSIAEDAIYLLMYIFGVLVNDPKAVVTWGPCGYKEPMSGSTIQFYHQYLCLLLC